MNKRQKKKHKKRYIKEIYSYKSPDGDIKTDVLVHDLFRPKNCNVVLHKSFNGFPFDDIIKLNGKYRCMNELSASLTTYNIREKLYNCLGDALKTNGKLKLPPLIPYSLLCGIVK